MAKRLQEHREPFGISRNALWLLGMLFTLLGMMSRGLLQTRALGIGTNNGQQLMELLSVSGGMTAAAVALILEALESCAVPIFAVLTLESFQKTRSVRKYLLRVTALALISEIPYNLALGGKLWDPSSRNPVFALVLGLVMLYLFRCHGDKTFKNIFIKVFVFAAALLWAVILRVKFGVMLLLILTVLWALRDRRTLKYLMAAAVAISCCVGNPLYMFSPFSFLLIHYYRGEKGNENPILHYTMYPLLLLLTGLAGWVMFS